jgi:2-polyprenyl-6-methoxyphenol hydroxylase-like FAD-dependent oxidoreductase
VTNVSDAPTPRHPDTLTPVDVAIVGGGIAGSTLGIVLARSGVQVAVVEREARFRDRIRGEALMPWGATLAGALDIADALPESGAHPLPIWQTYHNRAPQPPYDWRTDSPSGDGLWGVNHAALQETLLRRAEAAGATVLRPAKAHRPHRNPAGTLTMPVATGAGTVDVRARLIVGADGRESGVRRWIGAETIRDPVHHVIGGVLVEGIDLDPTACHVGFFPGGGTFIFRQASGRARAYFFCRPEVAERSRGANAAQAIIDACVASLPEGTLDRIHPVGPAAFFPGADIFASHIAGDSIVLIGDAAGANDPTQGQGLSLALKDVAELSRRLLASPDWAAAIEDFARCRPSWYEPLRAHAAWEGSLIFGVGPAAETARERADRARARDPLLGGYGVIHTVGPAGLAVDEETRRHYFGEDLDEEFIG